MSENIVELPQEIFGKGSGTFEGENYQLTIKGEIGYLWAITGAIPENIDFRLQIATVPGNLPVACCANDWDTVRSKPIYSQGNVIELKSVEREEGSVFVVIRRSVYTNLRVAIGIVFAI